MPLGFSRSNAGDAHQPLYPVALHRIDEDSGGFREQRRSAYRFYSNGVDRSFLATNCLLNCVFIERIAFDNVELGFPTISVFLDCVPAP